VISPVVYELIRLDGSSAGRIHMQDLKSYYPPLLYSPTCRYPIMDNQEFRQVLRRFWHRHRLVWEHIYRTDPGFWVDLEETEREIRELQWTQRGTVVVEYPPMSDVAIRGRPLMQDAGTETPRRLVRDAEVQAVEAGAEAAQRGCWNCRSFLHTYSECAQPRRWPFCFGCGTRNVTVRTCPNCGPEYRRTRPYRDP